MNWQLMQFAGPLFGRNIWPGMSRSSNPTGRTFVITHFWSTSALHFPPLHGNDTQIAPGLPGAAPSDLVQNMSDDMIAVRLVNTSPVAAGLLPAGGDGWLLHLVLISTRLSPSPHPNTGRHHEACSSRSEAMCSRASQWLGMAAGCNLRLLGSAATLEIAGGAAVLLGYQLPRPSKEEVAAIRPHNGQRRARARVIDSSLWT